MNSDWKILPLAELCEFRNGLWKGKKPPFINVGVIRNTNFSKNGALDDSNIAFLDVEEKQFRKRHLQLGDIILEKSGGGPKQPVGRVVLFDKESGLYSFSNFTSIIRLKDKSLLDFNYLHRLLYWYYLSGMTEGMQRRSTGIRNLDFSAYKGLSVPFPPLPVQKRIVSILDEAFAGIETAIANTEKNLANARELFEVTRDLTFLSAPDSWVERSLSELCSIKHGFAFKSEYFATEGKYVVLTPGSFWEHGGFRDQGKKTKFYTGETPAGFILSKGDFLLAMTEQAVGLLGSSLIVPESDRYLHNQRLGLVEVSPGVQWENDFFSHQLNTRAFREAVQATASGVKVRHTSPTKLGVIAIRVPATRSEQAETAERLNDLEAESDRLQAIYSEKLSALAELKQSLLYKAFSGELTADKLESEVEQAAA